MPIDTPAREVLDFGGLDITFDTRVLRPREWTTAQSIWAAELAAAFPDPTGRILELCAGAGHIGLLAVATTRRPLVAVDINPAACDFVAHNARATGLADLVEVREGALSESVGAGERFAVVIADPPWVPRGETGRFPDDPVIAIDGGDDGLDLARSCVAVIGRHLLPGGSAVLQLGSVDQACALAPTVARSGLDEVETRRHEGGVLVRLDPVAG